MKRIWVFGWLVVFMIGCGGEGAKATVNGKVTAGGKPVASGMVIITAENNTVVSSPIDKDGNYSLANVPLGKAKVTLVNRAAQMGDPTAAVDPAAAPKTVAPTPDIIPKKYEKAATSGLDYTVVKGPNEFNIDLKP